jgi:hypothetical protein
MALRNSPQLLQMAMEAKRAVRLAFGKAARLAAGLVIMCLLVRLAELQSRLGRSRDPADQYFRHAIGTIIEVLRLASAPTYVAAGFALNEFMRVVGAMSSTVLP